MIVRQANQLREQRRSAEEARKRRAAIIRDLANPPAAIKRRVKKALAAAVAPPKSAPSSARSKTVRPPEARTCKERPKGGRKTGSGASRAYIPWCNRRS